METEGGGVLNRNFLCLASLTSCLPVNVLPILPYHLQVPSSGPFIERGALHPLPGFLLSIMHTSGMPTSYYTVAGLALSPLVEGDFP